MDALLATWYEYKPLHSMNQADQAAGKPMLWYRAFLNDQIDWLQDQLEERQNRDRVPLLQ